MQNNKSLFMRPDQFDVAAKYVNQKFLCQPFRGVNIEKRDFNQRARVQLQNGKVISLSGKNAKAYIDYGTTPHPSLKNVNSDVSINIKKIEKDFNSPVLKIINRPNHGILHSMRAAAIIPVIYQHNQKNLAVKNTKIINLSSTELSNLQNMMLFSVIGREDETGFADSSKESGWRYQMFRAQSGTAYLEFCLKEKIYPANEREAYLDALVVELMGFPELPILDKDKKIPDPFPKVADMIIQKYGSLVFTPEERLKCATKLEMMNTAHELELLRCYRYESEKNPDASNLMHKMIVTELISVFNDTDYNPNTGKFLPYEKAIDLLLFHARLQHETGERKTTFVETDPKKIQAAIQKSKDLEKKLYQEYFIDALSDDPKLKQLYEEAISNPLYANTFNIDGLIYTENKEKLINLYDFEENYTKNQEKLISIIESLSLLLDDDFDIESIKKDRSKLKSQYIKLINSDVIEISFVKNELNNLLIKNNKIYPHFYKFELQDKSLLTTIIKDYYLIKVGNTFERSLMSNPKVREHVQYKDSSFDFFSPIIDKEGKPTKRNTDSEVDRITNFLNSVQRPDFFISQAQEATPKFKVDDLPKMSFTVDDLDGKATLYISSEESSKSAQMILRDLKVIGRTEKFQKIDGKSQYQIRIHKDKVPEIKEKLEYCQVQIPKVHSTQDTFFNEKGEVTALNLIKNTKAAVRVLSSFDKHVKGTPDYQYILNQLENPTTNRPVKGIGKDVTKKAILREGKNEILKNRKELEKIELKDQAPITQPPPSSEYWDDKGSPIDKGYSQERGAPKNTIFAKKESFSLLDPMGRMLLYPGIVNPKVKTDPTFFPIGFLSDIDEMHTHGERYIWSANTASNKRFWLGVDDMTKITKGSTTSQKLKSKTLSQLQGQLNNAAKTRENDADPSSLKWNELLLGCSKQSIKALFVPGSSDIRFYEANSKIQYELTAKPSTLIYRLNVLNHALKLKEDYGYDLPILVIDGVNPPKLYSEDMLKKDLESTINLAATDNFPYMGSKDKKFQEKIIVDLFKRLTKNDDFELKDFSTLVADKKVLRSYLKKIQLIGGDHREFSIIESNRKADLDTRKEIFLRQLTLNKFHFASLMLNRGLISPRDTFSDSYHDTPLHLACRSGSLKLVKAIVKQYSMKMDVNDNGETPLDVAKNNNHQEIINFLTNVDKSLAQKDSKKLPTSIEEIHTNNLYAFIKNNDVTGFNLCFQNYMSDLMSGKCKQLDFNQLGPDKESALNIAAKNNNTAIFIELLALTKRPFNIPSGYFGISSNYQVQINYDKVLTEAFKHNNIRLMEKIILHDLSSVSAADSFFSMMGASRALVGDQLDSDQRNTLHLYALCHSGETPYARALISHLFKNPTNFNLTFSQDALLKQDKLGLTPIMAAALKGNIPAISNLGMAMKLTKNQIQTYMRIAQDPQNEYSKIPPNRAQSLPGFNPKLKLGTIAKEVEIYNPTVAPPTQKRRAVRMK